MGHELDYPSIEVIKEFNRRIVTERNEIYSLEDSSQLEKYIARYAEYS